MILVTHTRTHTQQMPTYAHIRLESVGSYANRLQGSHLAFIGLILFISSR